MILRSIDIESFRNLVSVKLRPSAGINVFFGDNAQGKTNLLEAIAVLSDGISFRTRRVAELIRWGCKEASVSGEVEDSEGEAGVSLRVWISDGTRHFVLNRQRGTQPDEYYGWLTCVVFTADHLAIASGGPEARRRFLDRAVFGIHPQYLALVRQYRRILSQRNGLLRETLKRKATGQMETWNDSLVNTAVQIVRRRVNYLRLLGPKVEKHYLDLSGTDERIAFEYQSSAGSVSLSEPFDDQAYGERLRNKLTRVAGAERQRGLTLAGPHRDEFRLLLDGHLLRQYGSKGQQRGVVLACKIAETDLFREITGRPPVLLLDDVTSELDRPRCQKLFGCLESGVQAFISSTDYDKIGELYGGGRKYCIQGGDARLEEE